MALFMERIQKRRQCCTVEPALFLFMFASFLSYPLYQELLHHTFCKQDPDCPLPYNDSSSCNSEIYPPTVRDKTSHWILYTNLSMGLSSLLLSLLYGSLSDALKERRVFLALPSVGGAINSLIVIIVQCVGPDYTWVYLIGAGLCGLTGGFSVFNLSAYSYVSDISAHDDRTWKIGWLEATMYISSFLSQLLGGVWIQLQGYTLPYFGILACHITVVFYVILFLPPAQSEKQLGEAVQKTIAETRPLLNNADDLASDSSLHKRKFWLILNVFSRIYHFFQLLRSSWRHVCLTLIFFILEINFLGITDTVILYALSRLCWDSKAIGYFLAEKSGFNAIAALLILPVLVKMRVGDPMIAVIGLLFGSAALVVMGFATHSWIMFIVPVIGAMRGCVVPVVRSMLSKITPSDQQGIMFSGLSVIEASCIIVSSSLYNSLFPLTYSIYPGLCFFMIGACSILVIPLMLFLYFDARIRMKDKT